MLKRENIPHTVLNAKYHEKEAQIVAQAGKLGAVTIATNMAGRGTDIMLGGNADYLALNDLRKQDIPEELLAEANSYAETDQPEILDIRRRYEELMATYKKETSAEADQVGRQAACSSSEPSATSPGGSTISCGAAPAVREIPAKAGST